ncbi:MAG: amidohydrolase family protein, partial [Halobacteriales archaeon]|nr:amidohydrolase family protein [Halobacteriales archaeon]
MSPYALAAWLIFSTVGLAPLSTPQTALVLDHVTVVDVVEGSLVPDMRIVIRADTIRAVGRSDEIAIPPGARVVDGEGLYTLPGLWDMHVHLHAWEETGPALLVANGVTGVREMGGVFVDLDRLRRRIASDEIPGPRMVIAGEMLDGPTPGDWPFRITVTTPEEGRLAVRDQLERGVDFIKTKEFLDEETFLAIAEAAREMGLPLTGHVPQGMSAVDVARRGQRSVEHLAGTPSCAAPEGSSPASTETDPCPNPAFDAAVQAFLAQETWHTPTLTVARAFIDLADSLPSSGPRVRFRTDAV